MNKHQITCLIALQKMLEEQENLDRIVAKIFGNSVELKSDNSLIIEAMEWVKNEQKSS